ncbi:MAG: tetratricopeptide repeat protein [bacterium]
MKKSEEAKDSSRIWIWVLLTIIIFFGLCLRLRFVSTASKIPFNFLSDSSQYFSWAKHIISGKDFIDVYHQSPLYPFFLAFIFSLSGTSIQHVLIVQAIIGALSCFLVFYLSMRIFKNPWMGITSTLLMAIYAPAIFYNGMLLMATLVTFFNLIFLIVLLKALEDNKIWIWALGGLILGLSALARATVLLFLPFLAVFLLGKTWHEYRKKKENSKKSKISFFLHQCLFPLCTFFICTFLLILPVTLRNYVKGKDFVLIAANAGITFYEGNNPWATGQYMDPPGLDLGEDFDGGNIAGYYEKRVLSPSEISKFWFKESWRFIKDNPFQYLNLLGKKLAYFWNRYEIPNAENIYFAKQYSEILRLPLLSFLLAGSLGILGFIMALKKRVPHTFIVLLFLLSHMAANVLFFITARYRLLVAPILIIFMAYFILSMKKEILDKGPLTVLTWVVTGILVFSFVSYPWKGLNPKNDYASSYGNIGILFHLTGNPQKAIRYFQMSIEHDPTHIKSYNNIGGIYYAMGKKEEAMKYWKRGLEIDPQSPLIHLNLGNMYKREGQLEMAKKAYKIAGARMPYSIKIKELEKSMGF